MAFEFRRFSLQVQIRVAPIGEAAFAIERGAAEMDSLMFVLKEPDFPAQEEMLALFAEPGFIQRPPLLVRIVGLQELQLPSERGDQRMRDGGLGGRRGGHRVGGVR